MPSRRYVEPYQMSSILIGLTGLAIEIASAHFCQNVVWIAVSLDVALACLGQASSKRIFSFALFYIAGQSNSKRCVVVLD